MLNGCSLTVLIIGALASLAIISLHVFTIAIDYPLNVFSDSSLQMNWSGILSCIEIGVGAGVLMLTSVTAAPYIDILPIKNKTPIKMATIYYSVFSLSSIIIASYRFGEMGLLWEGGICSRTDGSFVCPTVLYRTEFEIENVTDCKFNNFNDSPSAWNTNGVPIIDWSNKEMYDKKSQATLFNAYKAARGTSVDISEDEMTLYHDCWYWGCDKVCNDRHNINIVMAYGSAVSSVLYIVLTVLSGVQSAPTSEPEPVEVVPLEPVQETKIPVIFPTDPQFPPTQGSSSDNSGTASSLGGASWKFKLRM